MPGQAPPALRAPGAPVGPALRAPGAPVGLYNEGATCYLNALLQLLFMLPVREAILKWRPDESDDASGDDASGDDASPPAAPSADLKITGELQRLFARLVLGDARAASTRDLVAAFGWSGAEALEQQDVSECLNVLCDRGFHGSARAALDELCGGTTVTVLERKDGTRPPRSGEPAPPGVRDGGERAAKRGGGGGTRASRVAERGRDRSSTAGDDVEVDCAATGERVAHSKREAIASPPGALFLTLKRFAMDWDAMDRVKDERPVDVPARLALGGADYGLCGALLHVGTCAEFNHWFGWS
ncbi:thiol-dependent ubiquitin-specific protease [Aureococcus anophagefferens]|uniref:Thiol-dependent ubiquitin-specific protease n=1 Tax=Aureococcus anophagefferens TaxID=44056 RepID=A0ABR1GEY5_AURAN